MRDVQFNERLGVPKLSSLHKRVVACPVAATFVTLGILTLVAQASWKDKDWTKWSREDCAAVVDDSGWGQSYDNWGSGRIDQYGSPTNGGAAAFVYFISALPIRQALARRAQLDDHYDKMPAQQKQNFDQKTTADLNADYGNRIVLHVRYAVLVVPSVKFVPDPPEAAVFILANGKALKAVSIHRINLERSDPNDQPINEFELTYPRIVNGQPVIKPTDKKITFIYGSNYGRAPVSFDPSKMMYRGKLEY